MEKDSINSSIDLRIKLHPIEESKQPSQDRMINLRESRLRELERIEQYYHNIMLRSSVEVSSSANITNSFFQNYKANIPKGNILDQQALSQESQLSTLQKSINLKDPLKLVKINQDSINRDDTNLHSEPRQEFGKISSQLSKSYDNRKMANPYQNIDSPLDKNPIL